MSAGSQRGKTAATTFCTVCGSVYSAQFAQCVLCQKEVKKAERRRRKRDACLPACLHACLSASLPAYVTPCLPAKEDSLLILFLLMDLACDCSAVVGGERGMLACLPACLSSCLPSCQPAYLTPCLPAKEDSLSILFQFMDFACLRYAHHCCLQKETYLEKKYPVF
jgi:hypothetical protein